MRTKVKPEATNYTMSTKMMTKARETFAAFKYKLPEELRDSPRYCYVQTVLGYLEIDIFNLLYLTARLVSPDKVSEITEDVLDMALRVVERLPHYLMNDLIGSAYHELLRERVDLELRQRKDAVHSQASRDRGIQLLGLLLRHVGPGLLEIDPFRQQFIELFSSNGYIGRKAWTSLVESKVRLKRRKGRPRKSEYDFIYEQRRGKTPDSYAKLLRRLSTIDTIDHSVLLNRTKAAVAYRKRKNL